MRGRAERGLESTRLSTRGASMPGSEWLIEWEWGHVEVNKRVAEGAGEKEEGGDVMGDRGEEGR